MAGSEAEQFSAVEKAPDHLQDDIAAAEVGGDPETSLAATSKTQVADPEASKCDPRVSMPFGSAILSCWVDYAGLAVLQPALPFYLAELGSDVDVVMWNGIILTGQFIAVVFGNIFWGRVVDKISSRNTLLLTMAGDAITFFITAFVREPWLLLVVRVFAGFSTPLTGALIFIFERAKSPMHALKGVSLFTLAVTFGYLTGGILVGAFYDLVGFKGVNIIVAVLCVVVAAYIALFSAPSRVVGKKPAPRGVKYALCSNEFYVHAGFAICTGWAMNCGMLLLIWLLRDNGATAQQAGFVFIGMPVVLASTAVLIPKVAGRIGSNATLSVGALGVCVIFTIQCIPWVQEHVAPLIAVWVVYKVFFLFVMITNQSKSRAIAAGYAINAGGQVTGIGRVFFALGQGVGPVVSAGLYEIHPSCAYAGLLGLFVANLIFAAVMGFPFFKDVEIKAAEGSPADKLKKEYETAIASSTAAASTTAITTSSAAANESSTAGQSVATPAEPTAAK